MLPPPTALLTRCSPDVLCWVWYALHIYLAQRYFGARYLHCWICGRGVAHCPVRGERPYAAQVESLGLDRSGFNHYSQ